MIGNDAYIFVKKMLRQMEQPEYQMATWRAEKDSRKPSMRLGPAQTSPHGAKGPPG